MNDFEHNLNAVEDLLSQSLRGFHFAFDKDDIKLALGSPINGISDFAFEDRSRVQQLFYDFVKKGSLKEKKSYLNGLATLDRELLIKAYFNILESTLKKCNRPSH